MRCLSYLLCVVALTLWTNSCLAQQDSLSNKKVKKIELIKADVFKYDKNLNKDVRRLIGHVVFKHDLSYLYCDSAYMYIYTNNLDAFGKVRIQVNDSTNVYGNKLVYKGDTKLAQLYGDVLLVDNDITLKTDYLLYDLDQNIAHYTTGAEIVKKENTLTSKLGSYFGNSKTMSFKDSVVLINPEYVMLTDTLVYHTGTDVANFFGPTTIDSDSNFIYCENGWYDTKYDRAQFGKNALLKNEEQSLLGDSLYYDRATGIGLAYRNIELFDSVQNIIIKGEFGQFNEKTDNSLVTDKAVLWMMEDADTLFLHADSLVSISDSAGQKRTLYAYHHVRFFRTDLQGTCDSMVYSFQDSMIYLYHDPVLWSQENQIAAEHIKIRMVDNKIEKMFLQELCFITSEYDTSRYNQIKGNEMIAYFKENVISQVFVKGNAETIYYLCEEDSSLIGMNKSLSNRIMIYIKENAIEKISLYDNPEAVMYPPVGIAEEHKFLKGFRWELLRRPKNKQDIFIYEN